MFKIHNIEKTPIRRFFYMNYKLLIPIISLLGVETIIEPINFQYQYRVVGNSYHPFDQNQIYFYKEKLIDNYEKLVFGFEEREYGSIIENNISSFEFDNNCIASYQKGEIILIIGNGLGPLYKGKLRRNECDESVIREKFYIFELFQ